MGFTRREAKVLKTGFRNKLLRTSSFGLLLGGVQLMVPPFAAAQSAQPLPPPVSQESELPAIFVKAHRVHQVAGAQQETKAGLRNTLTTEQLKKYAGVGGITTGILQNVAGVHTAGGDASGVSEGDFNIRGFNYSEIGVIRDGVPLNDPLYQTAHIDFDGDPENYGSVTVIPGSAPIGAPTLEASGGSIIVTTIDPTATPGAYFKEGFGNNNLFRTFSRFNTGEYDGFSAWVSVSHTNSSLWTQAPGRVDANRFEANLQYLSISGVKVNIIASDFHMWTNAYLYPTLEQYDSLPYDATFQGPTLVPGTKPGSPYQVGGSLANLNRADFHIETFGAPIEIPLNDKLKLSLNPYYVRVANGAATVAAIPLSTTQVAALGINPTQNRLGSTASLAWKITDSNTLNFGLWYDYLQADNQYNAYGITSDGSPIGTDGSGIITNAAGQKIFFLNQHDIISTHKYFIEDNWYITPQLLVTPGIAYEYTYNKSTNEPSIDSSEYGVAKDAYNNVLPRLAVTYQVNKPNQVYYDITTNVRPPAVSTLYSPTPDAPETAINQEIGWRYSTSQILVDTALFYDRFRNRQVSYAPNPAVTDYFNAGTVVTQGAQASIYGQLPANFNYQFAWTYVNAAQQQNYSAGGVTVDTKGKQLYDTPNNIGIFGVGYDNGVFFGDLIGHYTGSYYGDLADTQRIGGAATANLDGGYRFAVHSIAVKSGTLSINIDNMFDNHYLSGVYSGSVTANPSSPLYAAPSYYRGAPISVFANLAFSFE